MQTLQTPQTSICDHRLAKRCAVTTRMAPVSGRTRKFLGVGGQFGTVLAAALTMFDPRLNVAEMYSQIGDFVAGPPIAFTITGP